MDDHINADAYDHLYKIVLLGDTKCGKTFLLSRFVKGLLPKNPAKTIGVEFATKKISLEGQKGVAKLQIWDTAGEERYKAITSAHLRRALGGLVVYDVTDRKTLDNCRKLVADLREHADPQCVIMLVGNKMDLVDNDPSARQVSSTEAQQLAKELNLLCEEASSVSAYNVEEIFENLAQEIYDEVNDLKKNLLLTITQHANEMLRFTNVAGEEVLALPFDCTKDAPAKIWVALAQKLSVKPKHVKLITSGGVFLEDNPQLAEFLGCEEQGGTSIGGGCEEQGGTSIGGALAFCCISRPK